ncbi:TIR domain-containing protein [Azospirillum brasilense]|uniref:TIR domain-containing protein n=1 Tax=Azospirillum brasilense TaxID=192 RepID=UPI001FFE4E89|nr:TIR domain-containing protein [Azospirillum brasilense]
MTRILEELGVADASLMLSARKPNDVEFISELPNMRDIGTVIVDDFHRLPDEVKQRLSDYMKTLADAASPSNKLILVGINKAGERLVRFAHDLGMRMDVFRLEANPEDKILELIGLGEQALNISLRHKDSVIAKAQGSFHITQILCHNICVKSDITESSHQHCEVPTSVEVITESVMESFSRVFFEPAILFARGFKPRRGGRAPYLHILRWLSEANEWSIDLRSEITQRPLHRGSVGQVVEKGHLQNFLIEKRDKLEAYFHYEPESSVLSIEDPKFVFFIKNLVWRNFTKQAGFVNDHFPSRYDFALSFAGADRSVAEALFKALEDREIHVFYDFNEQHLIIGADVEEYLAPIYRSEAKYIVPFLSPQYPTRLWTKIESENFKHRFGNQSVLPIRFTTVQEGFFSDIQKYGGLVYDPTGNLDQQVETIANTLEKRLSSDKQEAAVAQAQARIEEMETEESKEGAVAAV